MKKIILLVLTALIAVGCDDVKTYHTTKEGAVVAIIDSCEYIKNYTYGGCVTYSHKGNCRFCKERRKQELKELVEQLKYK